MDKDGKYVSEMITSGNFTSPRVPKDVSDTCISTMRWTTERFHFAIEMNVLGKYDRIELVDGQLWCKLEMSPGACAAERRLDRYFRDRFSWDDFYMDGIGQLVIPPHTSASPDFKVHDRHQKYDWPTAESTHLVIEVMEKNSVRRDTIKKSIYAKGGIREYWIINLVEDLVEIHLNPQLENSSYAQIRKYRRSESFTSPFVGEVKVADLLPGKED